MIWRSNPCVSQLLQPIRTAWPIAAQIRDPKARHRSKRLQPQRLEGVICTTPPQTKLPGFRARDVMRSIENPPFFAAAYFPWAAVHYWCDLKFVPAWAARVHFAPVAFFYGRGPGPMSLRPITLAAKLQSHHSCCNMGMLINIRGNSFTRSCEIITKSQTNTTVRTP
jgi:hypothetical protein